MRKLNRVTRGRDRGLTVSAACLLLALTSACSRDGGNEQVADERDPQIYGFSELDADRDARVGWNELTHPSPEQLRQRGWTQQVVFDQFDLDKDNYLNEDEYRRLLGAFEGGVSPAEIEPVVATDSDGQADISDEPWPEFGAVETGNDGSIDWDELSASLGDELAEVGWSREQVMDQYDQNNNDALEEPEFVLLRAELTAANPGPGEADGQHHSAVDPAQSGSDASTAEELTGDSRRDNQLVDRPIRQGSRNEP